ncbi:hypothetical protein NLI96_g1765 [Meripilus lineatus]|uniref:Cytochrome P450 n=1 Tax=Meripilus lineatus TaxID=2056292 RepID=A0AAD5VFD4_9APHY|nr:hypothetical protein NLI96_g1765 [Physisporinus lineatus]
MRLLEGPNEVSIIDPNAISPLMGATGLPKSQCWAGRNLNPPIVSLISIRDSAEHARRRRPWNRAFSTAALREYERLVIARVAQLLECLAEQQGPIDLSKWISHFTYDVMGDVVFGGGSEALRDGDHEGHLKLIEDGIIAGTLYEHLPWLASLAKKIPGVAEGVKRMRKMGMQRAAMRTERGSESKDVFYYLNNDDGAESTSPPPAQAVAEGMLAIVAGSDTTSSTTCIIVWLLLRNPGTYHKLREEVDKFYPSGSDPLDTRHYKSMVYLDAVINEALRLYPAVLSGSQRSPAIGSGGAGMGSYFFPEGTTARIHMYTLHRDARNFSPCPDSFWPERWLLVDAEHSDNLKLSDDGVTANLRTTKEFRHNSAAFIPFSMGPANCAGKNLALMEMRMVICSLVQRFDMTFANGWNHDELEQNMQDIMVTKIGQLPIQLCKRREAW